MIHRLKERERGVRNIPSSRTKIEIIPEGTWKFRCTLQLGSSGSALIVLMMYVLKSKWVVSIVHWFIFSLPFLLVIRRKTRTVMGCSFFPSSLRKSSPSLFPSLFSFEWILPRSSHWFHSCTSTNIQSLFWYNVCPLVLTPLSLSPPTYPSNLPSSLPFSSFFSPSSSFFNSFSTIYSYISIELFLLPSLSPSPLSLFFHCHLSLLLSLSLFLLDCFHSISRSMVN